MIDRVQPASTSLSLAFSRSVAAATEINWPYDNSSGAIMPDPDDFAIDWNSPNPTLAAQQAYAKLVNWVQDNPGAYNGYVMLLQMTTNLSAQAMQNPDLLKFLQHPIQLGSDTNLLNTIAGYISLNFQFDNDGGTSLDQFINQVNTALGSAANQPPFLEMLIYLDMSPQYSNLNYNTDLQSWVFTDYTTGVQTPLDATSYKNFAASQIGKEVVTYSKEMASTIKFYYQSEIKELENHYSNNPWILLVALMSLINQRSEDSGTAVNGYSNNLEEISKANSLISHMLQLISSPTPSTEDMANFFSNLNQIQTLITQNPALASDSLLSNLNDSINTLYNTTVSFTYTPGASSTDPGTWTPFAPTWQPYADGIINFQDFSNGVEYGDDVLLNGDVIYPGLYRISTTDTITIDATNHSTAVCVGDLAALGGYSILSQSLSANANSTTVVNPLQQPFQNATTSIQALLNGPSSSIQQQIQNTTQVIQQMQNFQKEGYDSILNVIQQIVRMTQQSMG
ncbi:MAG: hypothetical protein QRY72_01770 [Candidatus Rhabdochlamydia sp.]